jgi:predicted nucleic acid-binding protein
MIVLDASALVAALVGRPANERLLQRVSDAESLHVPHLIDTEVNSSLRGLVRGRIISPDRAADALRDLDRLAVVRYPAHPLAHRVWALRSNYTSYDATYLALAEVLEFPVATCDRKLAGRGHAARVEVYA